MKWPKLITIAPLFTCLRKGKKEEVEDLASNLTDLVGNLRMIQEQDSLLELCAMDETSREVFERLWDDMADDLERQRLEHEAAQEAALAEAGSAGEGMFWPYNAALRVGGMQNFQDYWGTDLLKTTEKDK